MNKILYPKTYAKLIRIIKQEETWPYRTLSFGQCIYEFKVIETGEIIRARYPQKMGHTPHRIDKKRTWRDNDGQLWYITGNEVMIGETFKLYKRDRDSGRWSYRWLGQ